MKTLTARDASVLAVIASRPNMARDQRNRLLGQLSVSAKPIAKAMKTTSPLGTVHGSVRVASAVKGWSDSNRDASKERMLRRLG